MWDNVPPRGASGYPALPVVLHVLGQLLLIGEVFDPQTWITGSRQVYPTGQGWLKKGSRSQGLGVLIKSQPSYPKWKWV